MKGGFRIKNRKGTVKFIWIPRLIAIVFILFLMMFSFDVFAMEDTILEKVVGFIIHSLPSLLIIVILVLNWNNPFRSSLIFLILAVLFTLMFKTFRRIDTFIFISVPPLLVGLLFLLTNKLQKKG